MMKNLFTTIVLCLTIGSIQAQPNIEWQRSFGGSNNDRAFCIAQTMDNGFIIAGQTFSSDGDVSSYFGNGDIWVVKLDSAGIMTWQKSFGDTIIESATSIQQTLDGGYIVYGYSSADDMGDIPKRGTSDLLIIKLNKTGGITWKKSLGGSNSERPGEIQQTTDGGYIVGGSSKSKDGDVTENNGDFDYWIVKFNGSGDIVWQNSYGGTGSEGLNSIQQTSDGGYIAAGSSESKDKDVTDNHGHFDYWVIKIDNTGNLIWQKSFGGSRDDFAYSVKQTSDQGYIVAGTTLSRDGDASANSGSISYLIIKLDALGNMEWIKSYGGSAADEARSIVQTKDGGYVIAGYTDSNDGDVAGNHDPYNTDFWILKINRFGGIEWQKRLGGSNLEFAFSIVLTKDDGYAVAGSSYSADGDVTQNKGKSDYWIVKLSGTLVGVKELEEQPLFNLYPNPANIQLIIKTDEKLIGSNYTVLNIMGQTVRSGKIISDNTLVEVGGLPGGTYFVRVQSKDGNSVSRFVKE
jgi:hypothetical protein